LLIQKTHFNQWCKDFEALDLTPITTPQIILPSSNQLHLGVELLSRWAKVLLVLMDKANERKELMLVCLFVVGFTVVAMWAAERQGNAKEERTLQTPLVWVCLCKIKERS